MGIKIKWCQFERYDDPNLKDVILKGMTTEKLKKCHFEGYDYKKCNLNFETVHKVVWTNINNETVHKVGMDKYQQWNGPQSWHRQISTMKRSTKLVWTNMGHKNKMMSFWKVWQLKFKRCHFEGYDYRKIKDVILKGMTTQNAI